MSGDTWEQDDAPLRAAMVDAVDELENQIYATRAWCEAAERALAAYDACLYHAEERCYPTRRQA